MFQPKEKGTRRMTDVLTPAQRQYNMSRIRGTDTSIEVSVRKYLFNNGFRFRKNVKSLPGKPDIVLPKYHTVVFVHGCFWHRHKDCKYASIPQTNVDFWNEKFSKTVERDRLQLTKLKEMGWNVIIIWECELKGDKFASTMEEVDKCIRNERTRQ